MTRVVKLVFLDNDPSKRTVCDEANRTARVIKLPRAMVNESKAREELFQVGLYLLLGDNSEEPERPHVYVGESEEIYTRISYHADTFDKFAWHTALVLIAQDRSLNKAHVKYLENMWHKKLQAADVTVLQQTIPTKSSLNEAEEAFALDFSNTGQFLIEALGHRLFEKSRQLESKSIANLSIPRFEFLTSNKRGNKSFGQPTKDGFLVFAGSVCDPELKNAGIEYWKPVRQELLDSGIIGINSSGSLVFLKDWLAPSPSRAAAVAYGGSVNGLEYWRIENTNETLRSWFAKNAIA